MFTVKCIDCCYSSKKPIIAERQRTNLTQLQALTEAGVHMNIHHLRRRHQTGQGRPSVLLATTRHDSTQLPLNPASHWEHPGSVCRRRRQQTTLTYLPAVIITSMGKHTPSHTRQHKPRALATTCTELRKVLFLALSVCGFLFVYEISRRNAEWICTKFTRKTCLVPCSDKFEGQGQRWR